MEEINLTNYPSANYGSIDKTKYTTNHTYPTSNTNPSSNDINPTPNINTNDLKSTTNDLKSTTNDLNFTTSDLGNFHPTSNGLNSPTIPHDHYITSNDLSVVLSNPVDFSLPYYEDPSPNQSSNPFSDPAIESHYSNLYKSSGYECAPFFDAHVTWTNKENSNLVRKLDRKIAAMCCLLYVGLQLDRGNLQQVLSDDFLADLGLSTNDYNLGNTIFLVFFILGEIPSLLACKAIGAHYVIPFQMVLWSVVSALQCFLTGRKSFFAARAAIAILQSGLISELVLFLSSFYTLNELPVRLLWLWITQSLVQIGSAVLAVFILKMRGFLQLQGWRWLFLIEGLITLAIAIYSAPAIIDSPAHLTSRGFSKRERSIAVNRVLRDDPLKGDVTGVCARDLIRVICDIDLIPLYIVGFVAYIPLNALNDYALLVYRQLGWTPSQVNVLVIPYYVCHIFFLLYITRFSEYVRRKWLACMLAPLYLIPLLAILRFCPSAMTSPWGTWVLFTLITSTPYIHAICVGWVLKNSASVKKRSISSAVYNLCTQAGSIVAANIYRSDDSPFYHRGNLQLFKIGCILVPLLVVVRVYYGWRNKQKDMRWKSMSNDEQVKYIRYTSDEGNKRLDFRFDS